MLLHLQASKDKSWLFFLWVFTSLKIYSIKLHIEAVTSLKISPAKIYGVFKHSVPGLNCNHILLELPIPSHPILYIYISQISITFATIVWRKIGLLHYVFTKVAWCELISFHNLPCSMFSISISISHAKTAYQWCLFSVWILPTIKPRKKVEVLCCPQWQTHLKK